MKGRFILMGCSVSSGVPAIGNDWGNCDPDEPKNIRDRPCAVMKTDQTTLIIDTGPDFRKQMNTLDISDFDAVLYTHSHSDHILGIDELRMIKVRTGNLINIYGNEETITILLERFPYMFEDHPNYSKVLVPHTIHEADYYKTMKIGDIPFTPFYQDHGDCECLGYRFGNLGYSADMLNMGEKSIETLKGVDVWIADGAGHHIDDHPTHAPLSRLYELNKEINAREVHVIGLSKFMDYQSLKDELPEGFTPGYDGLEFSVNL
jgi:phosphoribosyl 1,2-cyclic phosphate phosphodiesterase